MHDPPLRTSGPRLWLLAMISVWGASHAAVKALLDRDLPPFVLLLLRFSIATAVLWPCLPRPRGAGLRRCWRPGLVTGAALLAGYALQTLGMQETTASMGGFLSGLIVLLVALGGWLVLREPLRAPAALGLCCGLWGIAMLCTGGDGPAANTALGIGLQIAAAVVYAAHILLISRLSPRGHELEFCWWQLFAVAVGGLLLAPLGRGVELAPLLEDPLVPLLILYLALFANALGIAVQSRVQPRIPAPQVAVLFAAQPAFAALAGFLFLDERLGPREWAGGALIVLGVLVAAARRRAAPPRPTQKAAFGRRVA